jgi:hypothetical protein
LWGALSPLGVLAVAAIFLLIAIPITGIMTAFFYVAIVLSPIVIVIGVLGAVGRWCVRTFRGIHLQNRDDRSNTNRNQ